MVSSSRANVVDVIANKAGMSLANTTNYNSNPGSIMAHAQQAGTNAENVANIAEQAAQQGSAQPAGSGGMLKTALTIGAFVMGTALGGVQAGATAAEVTSSVTSHMGLKANAGQGEMTIAGSDAAAAFEKGEYVSAFDGSRTNIMTGQSVAKTTSIGPTPTVQAKGMQNFDKIVAEQTAGMDAEDIHSDIMAKFKQNQDHFSADMGRLRKSGAINANDPNALAAEERIAELGENVKLAVPKPLKALNVGMGAPSFG